MADLAPDKRQQLDSIMKQMDASGASDAEMQAIVDDFTKKFSMPTEKPKATQANSLWDALKSMGASDVEEAQTAGPANAAVGSVVAPLAVGGIGAGAATSKLTGLIGPVAAKAAAGGGIGGRG